jgi:hypothetical protein
MNSISPPSLKNQNESKIIYEEQNQSLINQLKSQIKLENSSYFDDLQKRQSEIPLVFQRPLPKQFTLKWFKSKIFYDLSQSCHKQLFKNESLDSISTTNGNSGKHSKKDSSESFYVEISNENSPIIISSKIDDE